VNAAVLDKLITEAVIAGQQRVLGYNATPSEVTFLVCDIVEIDPIVSDSVSTFLDYSYDQGELRPHADWDTVVELVKQSSSYKFLKEAYSGQ
jgi:hypothetical protein